MPGSFEYIARQQHLHLNLNMAGALGGVNTMPYKILNSILGVPLVNAAHRRNISVEDIRDKMIRHRPRYRSGSGGNIDESKLNLRMEVRNRGFIVFYPLENFWLNNAEQFHLSDDIEIRLANEEEKKRMSGVYGLQGSGNFFIMEQHMDNVDASNVRWPGWLGIFSLRLLKAGAVGYNTYFNVRNRQGFLLSSWPVEGMHDLYIMEASEIPTVQQIYSQLEQAKNDKIFSKALRRFNRSYMKNLDDRLVDLMVSLETLFLERKDDEKNKLLQERVSKFLSDQINDSELLCKRLDAAYKGRNKILHEAERYDSTLMKELCTRVGMNYNDPFTFLLHIEDYVRISLRKWARLLANGSNLNAEIIRKNLL